MISALRAFSLALIAGSAFSPSAGAQVFYEPVQSQYGTGRDSVYYGGSNPRVLDAAAARARCAKDFSAVREGRYGVGLIHRGLIGSPTYYVASDCHPYQNAAAYGFTPTDARDAANAAVPRYFRKADLLRAARPSDDGRTWVVPAQADPAAGTIDIRPYVRPAATTAPSTGPATGPSASPRPLLIFPKKRLEPPAKFGNVVARAR